MALSLYQIKRWFFMLTGKSVWHVNQDLGKHFSKDEICGYYNNMKEKVTKMPELLHSSELPKLNLDGGKFTMFPVAIFQYGLGCYDLYLETHEECYIKKFMQCVQWTVKHQDEKGRWNNFSHYKPEYPYSSMAQGEGTSLLVRAYKHTGDSSYIEAAKRAIDYMILPLEKGGTSKYINDDIYLMEYTFKGMVLNGSIFSWWGLYDYVLATKDTGGYKSIMDVSLNSLVKVLPNYKGSYWSVYSEDGLIASPFYHNLHIAQMQAMYQLTGVDIFNDYSRRWKMQQENPFCKTFAFFKKAMQKIME